MPAFAPTLVRLLAATLIVAAVTMPARAQNDPASRRAAIEAIYPVMIHALDTKNYGRARNICEQAIAWEPQNPMHHYNLACIEAQAGGTRLPIAMGALRLAAALGFDDARHLQNDPDLIPLRSDPKFADVVRHVTHNASADAAISAIVIPPVPLRSTAPEVNDPGVAFAKPAPASFRDGVPVGLYLMNRYRPLTRTAEKLAWYFAPDGRVFQNLALGFSPEDLAAHAGPRGDASANGRQLAITWADGTKTTAELERDGTGFTWDLGIFFAVSLFASPHEITGVYVGEDGVLTGQRLELRGDGTFAREVVSLAGSPPSARALPATSGANSGHWELRGHSLILTEANAAGQRGLAFPLDDAKTPIKPDRMFFDGAMYRRLP